MCQIKRIYPRIADSWIFCRLWILAIYYILRIQIPGPKMRGNLAALQIFRFGVLSLFPTFEFQVFFHGVPGLHYKQKMEQSEFYFCYIYIQLKFQMTVSANSCRVMCISYFPWIVCHTNDYCFVHVIMERHTDKMR